MIGQKYHHVILELPVALCDKHLEKHKEPFLVRMCSGMEYMAYPAKGTVCRECHQAWNPSGVYLSRANLSGADLFRANYDKNTKGLTVEQKKVMGMKE